MGKDSLDKKAQAIMAKAQEVIDSEENDEDLLPSLIQLNPTHQRFVHMYLSGKYSTSKLAEMFDVHPNTILSWLKRKDVQLAITETQAVMNVMVTQQISAMTSKAVGRLNNLMDSPMDMVALQAVKDVLDRAGYKPKSEMKIEKTVHTFEQKLGKLIDETIEDVEYEVLDDE